ncbi:LPXTG cell wall anchor domain-containing protein [Glycomyces sp. L485]|uniref:LPXTG cell wall anchor domain-containing protein n=1 Tax=Glycomyces sp. L485 TaxID=2909235 RepID=UPI001F4A47CD|nr:LPXTG cell wall anchor domain-containing protein [Glycomyces sp. L485]MCH7232061.1 LPXTG cell wall anchor domain-containing protein [Glycomyces sp. L485]
MSPRIRSGLRIAGAGVAAAALTLAAAAPALAQDTAVDAHFSLSVNSVWGHEPAVYEDGQYGVFSPILDEETVTKDTEPFTVTTVFDFSAAEGQLEIELVDDERCETADSVVTCIDENIDHDAMWRLDLGDYYFRVSVGEDGDPGDEVPYRASVAIDGEIVDEVEDFIKISDEYGTWEYDPSMDHSTDHEPGDYDLAVPDYDIQGASGETVTVSLDTTNLGPLDAQAPIHVGAGEGSYGVRVQLPTGTEPAWDETDSFSEDGVYCSLASSFPLIDRDFPRDTGITNRQINCWFDSVAVDEQVNLQFPVTIVAAEPAADGIIALTESMELDADYSNNVAVLSLNSAQTDPGDDTPTDQAGSEKLPKTGGSSIVMVSAAAAAIAAGAVVFFVLRRRKLAQNWE